VSSNDEASLQAAFPRATIRIARVRQRFDSAKADDRLVGRPDAVEHLVGIASETLYFARQRLDRVKQLDDVEGAKEMVKLLDGVRGRMHAEDAGE
jgi:hypothetical protein